MTLTPFTNAPLIIQIHMMLAIGAVILTIAIFTLPKGRKNHRFMGRLWVAMMAIVALSSFGITELRLIGPFSPIHLLSLYVLWSLVYAVRAARAGRISAHKKAMQTMAFTALFVAGAFTFLPGRIMHSMFLGG